MGESLQPLPGALQKNPSSIRLGGFYRVLSCVLRGINLKLNQLGTPLKDFHHLRRSLILPVLAGQGDGQHARIPLVHQSIAQHQCRYQSQKQQERPLFIQPLGKQPSPHKSFIPVSQRCHLPKYCRLCAAR